MQSKRTFEKEAIKFTGMSKSLILHFNQPGLQTLVQDDGRYGWHHYGVPVSGPMDRFSAYLANWLVGNAIDSACLEITYSGPIIEFSESCQVAWCGADISPTLDGLELPGYQTIDVKAGSVLRFAKLEEGCRVYLAVGGTWQLPKILNSRSAVPYTGDTATPGSVIRKGSELQVRTGNPIQTRTLKKTFFQVGNKARVITGPEWSKFSPAEQTFFLCQSFQLSPHCNRLGYRLNPEIEGYESRGEMLSSGIVPGTIQISNSGQPVVLMADAQTTGGYPRIANVIKADLDGLGQLKPGDSLTFEPVNLDEARRAWLSKMEKFTSLIGLSA